MSVLLRPGAGVESGCGQSVCFCSDAWQSMHASEACIDAARSAGFTAIDVPFARQ